ncbi:acyl-CoA dehydrogenase family protein [Leptolyngbya sp. KIOST-1]|uniref:acyl-CoA dehydrogenase family protein n=1 Tax=Leptolyngbya sp. KIOST-1 TaxID=1229172 RepID=UPI0012E0B868|nr:acyl-CoA dehydrogenase family protein [Leptolyngbya sp. KIOST-1]
MRTPATLQPTIAELLRLATPLAEEFAAQAAALDRSGAFPAAGFRRLAAAGFVVAPLRSGLGGCGLGIEASSTEALLRLLKHIGRGNLAIGRVYEGHVNALQLIQTFGTAAQIERYGREVREQHLLFGVWNAEEGEGVTIVPLGSGRYRLEGAKTFCSGSGYVQRPFVNGKLPDGSWQMCIVPMDAVQTDCDRDWWQPLGMRATTSFKIDFTGVELGAEDLIGQPGDYLRQPWLSAGVVRFAAVQLGGAEALFDLTRQYLQGEHRTEHPYQQERLGQMAIALESGNLWLRGAAERLASYAPQFGGDPHTAHSHCDRLVAYANMTRTTVEQICIEVMQLCQRSVGARGLLPPHPMERVIRDLTLYLRQPAYDAAIAGVGAFALAQTAPADELWQV